MPPALAREGAVWSPPPPTYFPTFNNAGFIEVTKYAAPA